MTLALDIVIHLSLKVTLYPCNFEILYKVLKLHLETKMTDSWTDWLKATDRVMDWFETIPCAISKFGE